MHIGYSYWGFLADVKYDSFGNELSTPDGNAFYSWSIIYGLQSKGHTVHTIMPDRDEPAFELVGVEGMFSKFCKSKRVSAYFGLQRYMYGVDFDWNTVTKEKLKSLWDKNLLYEFDVILHEWRMEIPGRNDLASIGKEGWQPDYLIQEALLEYCEENCIKLIIFDLDYKITKEEFNGLLGKMEYVYLFELGNKWNGTPNTKRVEIPFDSEELMGASSVNPSPSKDIDLIYIGNRYERDEWIDRFIPDDKDIKVNFFGNWLQPGYDDCVERWPHIEFGKRLQPGEIKYFYDKAKCTILLAKDEYYKHGFMTARILEAVYYGCLPLFPAWYGLDIVEKYAGVITKDVMVTDAEDVRILVKYYKNNPDALNNSIMYLRRHLAFMDYKYICNTIIDIGKGQGV